MIGGLLKSTSSLAIIAAAGMFVGGLALTPAQAADLGGDCCADLEERVADLEATTARKGNRKVSLKISGHVNRAIGWWEDSDNAVDASENSEFYSAGGGVSGSRIQFSGSAKLSANWTAGYVLRLRTSGLTSEMDSAGAKAGGNNISHDRDYVYLKHAQLGTILWGQAGAPTDGVANISLAGRGVTGNAAGYNSWNGDAMSASFFDLEQGTHQAIAYVSPTIAGFTFAIAWADLNYAAAANVPSSTAATDAWDMALRYANEFGPIRIAAGIGYTTVDNDDDRDGSNVMGSVALMHTPTGLNVAFAAGTEIDGGAASALTDTNDKQFWQVEGGISQNFFGPGKTSIYGEYGVYDDDGATADDGVMWGLGIVQNFDSAATELYMAYRNWEDNDVGDGDVQQIYAGMRIKF